MRTAHDAAGSSAGRAIPVRCVIADQHEIVRDGVAECLSSCGYHLAGEASDGKGLVSIAIDQRPDLVITDVDLPARDGIVATKDILNVRPRTKIIFFTDHSDEAIEGLAQWMGAFAFVQKSAPADRLRQVIRDAAVGERARDHFSRDAPATRPSLAGLLELTSRERRILQLLGEGKRDQEISEDLQVKRSTVPRHVANLVDKLQADSRTEAVALVERFPFLGA